MATIQSEVMFENEASRRALERVGYLVTDLSPRVRRVDGVYVDSYLLTLISPLWIPRLYPDPEGLPEKYRISVQRVQETLDKAKEVVEEL